MSILNRQIPSSALNSAYLVLVLVLALRPIAKRRIWPAIFSEPTADHLNVLWRNSAIRMGAGFGCAKALIDKVAMIPIQDRGAMHTSNLQRRTPRRDAGSGMSDISPNTAALSGADALVKNILDRSLCFMLPSAKSRVSIQCIETTLGAATIGCVASLTR